MGLLCLVMAREIKIHKPAFIVLKLSFSKRWLIL